MKNKTERRSIPKETERFIWQEANNSCSFCGEKDIITHDKHHIEFVSRGGGNEAVNLLLVCSNCHKKIHAGKISDSEVKDRKAWLRLRQLQPDGYNLLDQTFFENEGNKGEARILHLRTASWSFILKGNYIDRDQQDELFFLAEQHKNFHGDSLLLILGEPGGGKTALMRRVAYHLYESGHTVLQMTDLHDDWRSQLRRFSERRGNKHFYVIADDIFRGEAVLDTLQSSEARDHHILFTFIGTTRTNEDRHEDLEGLGYKISVLPLNPPSEHEKQTILSKLEKDNDYSVKMSQLTSEEKQEFLDAPSMLVLMLQLSEGKPFHLIIEDVVMRLSSTEECPASQIFGALCNFNRFGVAIPEQILLMCLPKPSKRNILRVTNRAEKGMGELAGLIDKQKVAAYERLTTIHEIVAIEAIRLGDISSKKKYPYSSQDLQDYLDLIFHNLIEQNEIQRLWVPFTLWRLLMSNEDETVSRILETFSAQIKKMQDASSIIQKLNWQKVYSTLKQFDNQKGLINEILDSEPQNETDGLAWVYLLEKFGTAEQKRNLNVKIEKWLRDKDLVAPLLSTFYKYGAKDQKQKIIAKTSAWLGDHREDTHVRTKYLGLVESGTHEQRRKALTETQSWLRDHREDSHVRAQYLVLVERCGSADEKLSALSETGTWLESHPEDSHVRTKYISLSGKEALTLQLDILEILNEQWNWIQKQTTVPSDLWCTFLQKIYYFLLDKYELMQSAVQLALKQHPDDSTLINTIFGYLRDHLEQNLVGKLAVKLISLNIFTHKKFMLNYILAANFLRDQGSYEKSEPAYKNIIKFALNKKGQIYTKTYIFSTICYAQQFLLRGEPDIALTYLKPILDQNSKNAFAYLIKAKCFQKKQQLNEAMENFEKAIHFDKVGKGFFHYEFGCFFRNCLKDIQKARKQFETAIQKEEKLPAYIELAEIELELNNQKQAKLFLQKGLNLELKNRRDREKYDNRINALIETLK